MICVMNCATLALHFSKDSSETSGTSLRVTRQDPPWRALRAFSNASGEALVHLHNVSGGVLGGDNLRLEVSLDSHAQAQITTVGATRIHRHRPDRPESSHASLFRLANGAFLEYLPDPVIPFARSRFSQHCEIHLSSGAGLVCWETLSAGRVAHGESFSFERFSANTEIHSGDGPIALERYSLAPELRSMNSPARMGSFRYSATMYVCRADNSARWLALENSLNETARELDGPETRWGVSALVRHGLVVRGMVRHAHQASAGLRVFWQAAKQAVWDRAALLPRKIY
jgi:urease accessory protein